MIDFMRASNDQQIRTLLDELRTLYRARPFTKAVPFNQTMTADPLPIWTPVNSYFEVGKIIIRSSIAGVDLSICDTVVAQPFGFAMPPTTIYQEIDYDPGYRSLLAQQAKVLLFDASASGTTVKGVILGWEVTPEGFYR